MTEQLRPTIEQNDSESFQQKVRQRQAAKAARTSLNRYHPDRLDLPASKLYSVQQRDEGLRGDPADAKLANLQEMPRNTTLDPLDVFQALDTPNAID